MLTAAQHLELIDQAIQTLLEALRDQNVQEYYLGSRRIRRAEFGPTLRELYSQHAIYEAKVNAQSRSSSPIRVAKLGRARAVDR